MKGFNENESLETVNLSDNDLNDQEGLFIVRYIKNQAEKRENALWRTGLRHSDCSQKQLSNIPSLEVKGSPGPDENAQFQKMRAEQYKNMKDKIQNRRGLREIVLKRNNLGAEFMEALSTTLRYDRFIKVIDVSQNLINE